jgi:hypothetical protein
MKNLHPCLYVLAVLCLIGLLVPSTVLAQEDGVPPCCYGRTAQVNLEPSIDVQSTIIVLGILIETSISQATVDAGGGTAEIVDNGQQIPLMLPRDSYQSISQRRTDYLTV